MKMSVLYENVGALWKCRRFTEMSAFYENVRVLWKCRHSMKMLPLYKNVGTLLKWRSPIQQDIKNIQQQYKLTILLFGLANSTVTALLCSCWWFSFSSEGGVPSAGCCWVPATASQPAFMGALTPFRPPWSYRPNVGVLLKCWCSTQK